MIGRVLRPADGKTDALILDHSGAVFMHGFPDDEIIWTLHEDRRAENITHSARGQYHTPTLTTCPECSAVRYEGKPCVVCGWHPVAKPRHVTVVDGELGEVGRDRTVTESEWTSDERQAFYRQLMGYAQLRQYKPGWAAHKFREKFGAFPPFAWNSAEPAQPSGAVASWVRSRQIAYARAMEAQRK